MEQFPPNSRKAGPRAPEPKRVERVTSAEAVRRKRSLGDRFSNTFFSGDARSALEYVIGNVIVPNTRDLFYEGVTGWFGNYVYGDRQSKRGRYAPPSGAGGYVSYNQPPGRSSAPFRPDDRPPTPRMLSRESRTRHDFDAIIINSRQEAEEVLDRLFDLISQHGSAEVADLYELTGIQSSHQDHKWGWTDMRGARVGRVRRGNGYVLDLPDPEFFQ